MQTVLKGDKVLCEFTIGDIDADILSLFTALETAQRSKAAGDDISILSEEIKEEWWKKNKQEFIDENSR